MSIKGAVQEVFSKPWVDKFGKQKTFYTMKVSGEKISTGTKQPPEVGTYIEFDFTTNAKGYKDTAGWTVLPGAAPSQSTSNAVNAATSAVLSKDDYWTRKEARDLEVQKRIEIQSCRNSAISFVQVLLQTQVPTKDGLEGIVPVPAKGPKRLEFVEALLAKYEAAFLAANSPSKGTDTLAPEPSEEAAAVDEGESAWG